MSTSRLLRRRPNAPKRRAIATCRLGALLLVVAPMLVGCRDPYFDAVCDQYHAAVSSVDGNGGDFSAYWKHLRMAQGNLDPAREDSSRDDAKLNQLSAGIRSLTRTQRTRWGAPPHIESRDVEIACK
jgi:hypothetical protein